MVRQIKKSFSAILMSLHSPKAEHAGDPRNGDQDPADHCGFCSGKFKSVHNKRYYHFQKGNTGGGCRKQYQDKEDHTEKLSSRHLSENCRQCLEHKAWTAFRVKSKGKDCWQYSKSRQHCYQSIASGNTAGTVGDLLVFSQISAVCNGCSRTQRQRKENLSQRSQEGSRSQFGKVRFQEKFNPRACAGSVQERIATAIMHTRRRGIITLQAFSIPF